MRAIDKLRWMPMSRPAMCLAVSFFALLLVLAVSCRSPAAVAPPATMTAVASVATSAPATPAPSSTAQAPTLAPQATATTLAPTPTAQTTVATQVSAAPQALLFARADDLYRADADGGRSERLTVGGLLGWGMALGDAWWVNALTLAPRVSPDGRRVAFSPEGDTVVVVDVQNPATPLTLPGSAVFAWSPDSGRLAVATHVAEVERAQLVVYDLATGAATPLLDESVADIAALVWSPDGQSIAFGCCFVEGYDAAGALLDASTGQVYVVDLKTKQVERAGESSRSIAGGVQPLCWTADNRLAGGDSDPADPNHCSAPPDAATSPNGQRRFSVSGPPQPAADSVYQLNVEEVATGETWQRPLEGGLWPIAWSPDGRYILLDDSGAASPIWRVAASGAGEVEVLIDDGRLLPIVVQPAPTSALLTYHSDGHLYRVMLDGRGGVRLTTEPLAGASDLLAVESMLGYRPPVVSPDGQMLAFNGNWGGTAALDLAAGALIGHGRGRAMLTPRWAPDSRQLAYLTLDDRLCIYQLDDKPAECPFAHEGLWEAVWSPTGSLIAAAIVIHPAEGSTDCCDGWLWLVNAATGAAGDLAAFRVGFEYVPGEVFQWLPDGSGLVIKRTGEDGGGAIVGLDGSLVSFDEWIADVAPDGGTVLHPSGPLSSVDGTPLAPLPGADGCTEFLSIAHAWSPDGRLAYTLRCGFDEPAQETNLLTVFDPATGAVAWQRALPGELFPVGWSLDGRFVLVDSAGLASPLWRLAANGSGEPEVVVEDGYLLAVVRAWE